MSAPEPRTNHQSGAAPPTAHFELKCCVDGSMLKPLREFVSNVARTLGYAETQVAEVEICVDEACANAMEHAYAKSFEREFPTDARDLAIEITYTGNEMTVRVIDYGCGEEGGSHPKLRDLDEYLGEREERFRGLGMYLMHKFMDRVTVKSAPGKGTTVEMTKIRK